MEITLPSNTRQLALYNTRYYFIYVHLYLFVTVHMHWFNGYAYLKQCNELRSVWSMFSFNN